MHLPEPPLTVFLTEKTLNFNVERDNGRSHAIKLIASDASKH
jgi:hypothetical protein